MSDKRYKVKCFSLEYSSKCNKIETNNITVTQNELSKENLDMIIIFDIESNLDLYLLFLGRFSPIQILFNPRNIIYMESIDYIITVDITSIENKKMKRNKNKQSQVLYFSSQMYLLPELVYKIDDKTITRSKYNIDNDIFLYLLNMQNNVIINDIFDVIYGILMNVRMSKMIIIVEYIIINIYYLFVYLI